MSFFNDRFSSTKSLLLTHRCISVSKHRQPTSSLMCSTLLRDLTLGSHLQRLSRQRWKKLTNKHSLPYCYATRHWQDLHPEPNAQTSRTNGDVFPIFVAENSKKYTYIIHVLIHVSNFDTKPTCPFMSVGQILASNLWKHQDQVSRGSPVLGRVCASFPRDPGLTETENGFMEPKYLAFRRWL